MIELLAQAAEEAGRLGGLSVVEWGTLLAFLATFVGAVVKHLQAAKGARKIQAVVSALEEAAELHPKAIKLAKILARDKATKLGVETGWFGLEDDVRRHTQRFNRSPISGELGPDDPTPDQEAPK